MPERTVYYTGFNNHPAMRQTFNGYFPPTLGAASVLSPYVAVPKSNVLLELASIKDNILKTF